MSTSMRKYLAEGIGTFVLVFGGVGSAVIAGNQIGYVGVALAFGLSLLAMAYAIGSISGCHINPAVTFAMLLAKRIGGRDALGYVAAQLVGAVIAAFAIAAVAKGQPGGYDLAVGGLGANGYGSHSPGGFDMVSCLFAEAVLTFLLALTVLGATSVKAPAGFAGLPIGVVLTVIHLVGIPVTNTSVNPARSFGPALLVGDWALSQLWLFVVGPLLGAAVAVLAYKVLRSEEKIVSLTAAEGRTGPRVGGATRTLR